MVAIAAAAYSSHHLESSSGAACPPSTRSMPHFTTVVAAVATRPLRLDRSPPPALSGRGLSAFGARGQEAQRRWKREMTRGTRPLHTRKKPLLLDSRAVELATDPRSLSLPSENEGESLAISKGCLHS